MVLFKARGVALSLIVVCASSAFAQFNETEGNDSKAAANVFSNLANGATITGNSTASTGAGLDYFRISTAAAGLGVYRHRMVIQSETVGHTGTIRGLGQVAAAGGVWDGNTVGTANATDTTIQTTSTTTNPARFNQWYGFGKSEELYYRVTGTTATSQNYVATYSVESVNVVDLGNFAPGLIDIRTHGQGHTSDTDMWIYDSGLNAIRGYGNDDEGVNGGGGTPGTTLQSLLRRQYGVGRYYLALTTFNLANNQGSPNDDDFRTGAMMDFANSVVSSSTTANVNLAFAMTDSSGTRQFAATKAGPYDVYWATFNVVPEPASMAALGLGAIALIRRRNRK